MKKEYILVIPTILIFILLNLISLRCNNQFHFRLEDYFIDTSNQKRMIFMFVEVNKYDSLEIWANASKLLNEHHLCQPNASQILISQYYQKDDKQDMPIHIQKGLKRRFPLKIGIHDKFEFYPSGYIFTGTNSPSRLKLKNKIIQQKSLTRVPVTKPKPQYKAKDI